MKPVKTLMIGACKQIGTELTVALKSHYGTVKVLAEEPFPDSRNDNAYRQPDVPDTEMQNPANFRRSIPPSRGDHYLSYPDKQAGLRIRNALYVPLTVSYHPARHI